MRGLWAEGIYVRDVLLVFVSYLASRYRSQAVSRCTPCDNFTDYPTSSLETATLYPTSYKKSRSLSQLLRQYLVPTPWTH